MTELTDVDLVGSWVPVSNEYLEDMRAAQAFTAAAFERVGNALKWAALGSRDPWPNAGFDFRLNAPHNRYPAPGVCGECGRPLDDDDC